MNNNKSFDIFCAPRPFTSSQFDFSTHFEDYSVFHAPANILSRRGRKSGGVAVLVRKSLMQFVTSVECDYDNMICFKLSKDRLGIEIYCLSHYMCHHIKALTINNATQTVASITWKISS